MNIYMSKYTNARIASKAGILTVELKELYEQSRNRFWPTRYHNEIILTLLVTDSDCVKAMNILEEAVHLEILLETGITIRKKCRAPYVLVEGFVRKKGFKTVKAQIAVHDWNE